jgi:hypothetical protein
MFPYILSICTALTDWFCTAEVEIVYYAVHGVGGSVGTYIDGVCLY